MADDQRSGASEVISKSANAAKAIQGAVKTGKAIAGVAKGAAAGGPYGAALMGILQNRKTVAKIIVAAAFILLFPILFILMLPALIFGGFNKDSPEIPVMNDNEAIYANIENINDKVYGVIEEAHWNILSEIDAEVVLQPEGSRSETVDDYASQSLLDTALLISQYQVYKDDYEDISVDDLISILNNHKTEMFLYNVATTEEEIVTQKVVEKIVTEYNHLVVIDANGNETTVITPIEKIVEETVDEIEIQIVYTYTVDFVGSEYFADTVFKLTPEKASYARDLGNNLAVFLGDKDSENVPNNDTHGNIGDKVKGDTGTYSGGVFIGPIENWQNHITSEFGYRIDPFNGSTKYHNGMDIAVPIGTPIYAAAGGTVISSKKLNTGYGHYIVINHGGQLTTLYAHCSKLFVSEGDTVKRGDKIAEVGTTGRSTGPHLHFEAQVSGTLVDPRDYL